MARRIDAWYADAEGGGWDLPGLHWQNDDKPDRTPDSWLDRRMPVEPRRQQPQRSPASGFAGRRGSEDQAAARPNLRNKVTGKRARRKPVDLERVRWHARLCAEIDRIRARSDQRLDAAQVARRLQKLHFVWEDITPADVRQAAAAYAEMIERVASPHEYARIEQLRWSGRDRRRRPDRPPDVSAATVAAAAHTLRRQQPSLTMRQLVEQLAGRSPAWSRITPASLQKAMRDHPPMSPITTTARRATTRPSVAAGVAERSWTDRPPRPNVCEACGVAYTDGGVCRCS